MFNTQTLETQTPALQNLRPLHDRCCETTLQQLQHLARVVLTGNYCPCYLKTLQSLKPKGILGTWDDNSEKAILALARGEVYYSPMLYESPLTEKQRQVLRCNAKGLEVKEIAAVLKCEPETVNTHFRNIYEKLRPAFPNLKLENTKHLLFYWRGEWHLLER
jgi:DNA-binding NarL/FixJ family response regulator